MLKIFLPIFCFFFAFMMSCANQQENAQQEAYVFYYFEGYAGEKGGLHAAYSYDLNTWYRLGDSIFSPSIGEWKVFRDPSVIKGKQGDFHLVWTTGKSGFGYAWSDDGITWKDTNFITVDDTSRNMVFANVWAPEFYQGDDSVYIIWSSTRMDDYVPPKDPEKWWTSTWNHRFYYTSTKDFEHFSPTRPFWDPGFNAIDAVIYKTDSLFYLFFKDERRTGKNVILAHSENFTGPYTDTVDIGYRLTEGAIPVETDTALVVYYDYYHEYNGYRYITTKDMHNWSEEVLPQKHDFEEKVIRHGSIVKVSGDELQAMLEIMKQNE